MSRGTVFFNETFILVTMISGHTLPFYYSQSAPEVEALLKQTSKISEMINNPQIMHAFPMKSFYRHSHEA